MLGTIEMREIEHSIKIEEGNRYKKSQKENSDIDQYYIKKNKREGSLKLESLFTLCLFLKVESN